MGATGAGGRSSAGAHRSAVSGSLADGRAGPSRQVMVSPVITCLGRFVVGRPLPLLRSCRRRRRPLDVKPDAEPGPVRSGADTAERHGAERERPAAPRGTVARRKLPAASRRPGPGGRGGDLVCAPAGSGKTVLDAVMAARRPGWPAGRRGCRWSGERDGQRFWLSVIGALADVAGDGVVTRVSPRPVP